MSFQSDGVASTRLRSEPQPCGAGLFEPFGDLAEQIQAVEASRPRGAARPRARAPRRPRTGRRWPRAARRFPVRTARSSEGEPRRGWHARFREPRCRARAPCGRTRSTVAHERIELEAVALRAVEGVLQNACVRDHEQAAALESPAQGPSQFELDQLGRAGRDGVGVELMEPHVVQLVLGKAAVFPRRGWREHDVAIDVVVEDRHALANRTGQERSAHRHVDGIGRPAGTLTMMGMVISRGSRGSRMRVLAY